MNIVQTTITYPPALGGMDRYVRETSDGLVTRGHRVVVVTTDLEQPLSRQRLTIPAGYVDSAEVHRLRASRIPRLAYPFALGMKAAIRRSMPDVIHTHGVMYSPALFSWQVARRSKVPLVINSIFSPRYGFVWDRYLRLARRIMNDAACVIAISEFERSLLIKGGMTADKVVVLSPGVDLSPLQVRHASIFPRYGIADNRVIVSLGRLAFGKRVDRLIQSLPSVIAKHPDVRLLIIGPDYGDEARLRQLVQSLDLARFVTFAGPLPQDEVTAALQCASLFAMTTDFELFGITLIEAMAAGAAVVAPDVASIPNVVRNGETGLLYRHDDVSDLSAKLNLVLGADVLARHLVDTGKRDAATRFDFQRNLDALEDIYRKACSGVVRRRSSAG